MQKIEKLGVGLAIVAGVAILGGISYLGYENESQKKEIAILRDRLARTQTVEVGFSDGTVKLFEGNSGVRKVDDKWIEITPTGALVNYSDVSYTRVLDGK